jgi:hypothetical protein
VSPIARPAEPTRRFWLVSPAAVLAVLGVFALALIAAGWPLASLARLNVTASTGGPPWWEFAPFGMVGFVIAWRRPGNALGWCLAACSVAAVLSDDGSLYAIAAYRIRPGTLPLGWLAMLAQPGWAISIVLIGVAVLIFPDGRPASPLLRWVLWLYLAPALVWMVSAYVLTLDAIGRHAIRVDSGGNLLALDNGHNSPGWWNVLQYATFVTIGLSLLLVLAGQVASFRRASGEHRQQLKWLLGGFSAFLVGGGAAIALAGEQGGWKVVAYAAAGLATFALPVSMAVAILKYRLYDIDRIISRTVAYAIITGVLVGVYAGLVLLATQVLGLHSTVAVAAATLAAAALFAPVRSRVQRVVDRRFNRARYDAERTVAAFAARLKDTVDLNSVRDDLAGVVHQALEPAHVSVWLNRPG